ncbi:MAG: cell division protein FtsQ/DivIB [Pseudomonadota bacterium]
MRSVTAGLPARRDPAPSRIHYKLDRLWLTPLVRRLVRTGVPVGVALGILLAVATDPRATAHVGAVAADIRSRVAAHPDLAVTTLEIAGASPSLAARIDAHLGLTLPASALDLDLATLRTEVERLGPVARAEARFESDGRLHLEVVERVPEALLLVDGTLRLIDRTGAEIARPDTRAAHPDLPVLTGPGAASHVDDALRLAAKAQPIGPRLRGLVRVGERRWDIALSPDLTIRLPEREADAALQRLMALHKAKRLLDRDLSVIDLRDPDRPVARLTRRSIAIFRGVPLDDEI